MADKRELLLAVKGKDDGASRVLKDVGDEAERSEDKLDGMRNGLEKLDKKISDTKTTIADLRKEIHRTGDVELFKDVNKQTARLRNLGKQKDFLLAGDDAGKSFAGRMGASLSARIGPLLTSMPISGPMAAVGAGAAAVLAPTIAGGIAGAVVGGAGIGGVIGGVALAARDPAVQAEAAGLSSYIGAQLQDAAEPFVPATIDAIRQVRGEFDAAGDDLRGIFADSAGYLEPLAEGAARGARLVVQGFGDAVGAAGPVVDQLGRSMESLGGKGRDVFSGLAQYADEGASALDDLTNATENFVGAAMHLVQFAAEIKGGLDGVDRNVDSVRYKLENLIPGLDITADGFARGSKEAEAYRQVTLGTATAADFQVLANAKLAESQKTVTIDTEAVAAAFANSNARLAAAKVATDAEATSLKLLRDELDRIADTNISAAEASLNYRDAVNEAKNAADGHKKVSAAEERQLLSLATSSNSLTGALEKQGASTAVLSRHTNTARANFVAAAQKMGYTKTQAEQLAAKYLTIPPVVSTTFTTPGLSEADRRASGLQRRMRAMDGSVVDITFKYGFVGGDPRAFHNRMGGVYEHAASGLVSLRQAGVFSPAGPARYAFAEPQTGGEAFIPKRGDTARSMAILDKAASWYGASVTRGGQMQAMPPSRVDLSDASTDRLARAMARELAAVWMGMYQGGSDAGRLANIYSRTG